MKFVDNTDPQDPKRLSKCPDCGYQGSIMRESEDGRRWCAIHDGILGFEVREAITQDIEFIKDNEDRFQHPTIENDTPYSPYYEHHLFCNALRTQPIRVEGCICVLTFKKRMDELVDTSERGAKLHAVVKANMFALIDKTPSIDEFYDRFDKIFAALEEYEKEND